jgi:hypothetical protein
MQCIADNESNASNTDSGCSLMSILIPAQPLGDKPKIENLTTSDAFLIAD